MKSFVCTLLLSMVSVFALAQTEPEFEMEPYVFGKSDSALVEPLPCETAYMREKASAAWYLFDMGKIKTYNYIKGKASPLQIDPTQSDIIIRNGSISPRQVLSIVKLQLKGSKRRWKIGQVGTFSGTSYEEEDVIPLKYKTYGEGSVILSTSGLEPGEYCLVITNMLTDTKSAKVYTFSII